jgi:hypothetical protein
MKEFCFSSTSTDSPVCATRLRISCRAWRWEQGFGEGTEQAGIETRTKALRWEVFEIFTSALYLTVPIFLDAVSRDQSAFRRLCS